MNEKIMSIESFIQCNCGRKKSDMFKIKIILHTIFDNKISIQDISNKNSHTNSTSNILYRLQMKFDKDVSTWRIWGFYIQCLKELNFANIKSIGQQLPLTQ